MNGFEISTASDIRLGSTTVSAVYYGSTKLWPLAHDYSQDYFTIISLVDNNTISLKSTNRYINKTISISMDNGITWTSVTSTTNGVALATLNTGDKILIKGSNTKYSTSALRYNYFISTGKFDIEGNIMSLIYGDNFINQTTLSDTYVFCSLFKDCSNLFNAEHLILPATTLTDGCYGYMFSGCSLLTTAPNIAATTLAFSSCAFMFSGCTSLAAAPVLPATTLANNCYQQMFNGCSSLTTAPELPATTLAERCYFYMFNGCSSLTTAPELPATTLAPYCYEYMFNVCRSLNNVTCLATDISASGCTNQWLFNVAATGTFIKASSMTSWTTGVNGIPEGWTVVDAS